jgi:Holliday junction DNA helicase RuvA
MISAVRGTLAGQSVDAVFIEVGGVTLRITVPATTLARLPALGEPVRLHTHLHVREDVLALYGFADAADLAMFQTLLTVTGVGPKLAIGVLSATSADRLRLAIAAGNVQALTAVPGVGKKLAGRLVLELKGKLDVSALAGAIGSADSGDAELMAALTGLGYTAPEAQEAIRSLPPNPDGSLEERIVQALRHFAG